MCLKLVSVLCFLYFVSGQKENDLELKMSNVLYRHGDRSPVATFPKDEHKSYWKQGLGQLTEIGMKQEFLMGKFLKKRYLQTILNQTYLRKQVHCRSSDRDRCLMSAEAQMAGLYPPLYLNPQPNKKEWQFWQLIPIHTVPKNLDMLLRPYDYNCPRLQEISEKSYHDPKFVAMAKKYKDFMGNVSAKLGLSKSLNLTTIYKAYDSLFCQRAHNLSWPTWVTPDVFNKLTILQYFDFVWMFNSPEKAKLTGGNLLGAMVTNMKNFRKNPNQSKKLYVYSAHDTTVVALLSALKIYSGIPPPYSTAFLMELYYSRKSSKYFVRMFYRNDTSQPDKAYELFIPGCQVNNCTLDNFTSLTASAVPVDFEAECHTERCSQKLKKDDGDTCGLKSCKDALAAVLIILLLVFIAFVGYVVRRCQVRRKAKSLRHFQQIENEEWDSE
ncbi:prostatic acid phosphatase-like [Dendronephthya gigantea]|uniref:prostatic acid phosphatase-like n=1 Tax=Dendronephthya gigantea TaxID=151771 RepID=UPI00106BF842|nr:prostatic acid phosphatase-like [Dendronephthya gigantea]